MRSYFGGQLIGPHDVLEQLLNRFLYQSNGSGALMLPFLLLEDLSRVLDGFIIKIEQGELRMIAQPTVGEERLHFPSWTAAQAENPGFPASAHRRGSFLYQPLLQKIEAAPMRGGGALMEQPDIEHFGEDRTTLLRIAQHHVDHLVVSRVAQRLSVGAVGERGAG